MFGRSLLKDFDDDPFFSGFNNHHSDIFDRMGRFPDPFMAVTDGGERDGKNRRHRDDGNSERQVADPFGGFFHSMNTMMSGMHKQMAGMQSRADSDNLNCHSFSSSSVMSYSKDGKSEPKYFEASSSTRRAPGQIKETRCTLRDSESGIEKMAVGHHIGERGKIMEKRRNTKKGGGIEEERNYIHMAEDDEPAFDKDWRYRTSTYNMDYGRRAHGIAAGRKPDKAQVGGEVGPKKRALKTPAAAPRGLAAPSGLEPSRPHGPSKSGRARSKY